MRNILYLLLTALVLFAVAACDAGSNDQEETSNQPAEEAATSAAKPASEDLGNGVDSVLSEVKELKKISADNVQKMKRSGNSLRESWDKIEKEVEENYLNYYMNIEHTLYPLIGETQKDTPDGDKVSKLCEITTRKLEAFKKKIG
ncbi:hypothetical protein [Virgibacillus siamensis]|uniref:hypothetical protein n=1 Tax=Virgibacillus siamensis TaxID=480071 RepID=UPI0009869968|nr:hypothetical protein [Virgibacillus siamensis]